MRVSVADPVPEGKRYLPVTSRPHGAPRTRGRRAGGDPARAGYRRTAGRGTIDGVISGVTESAVGMGCRRRRPWAPACRIRHGCGRRPWRCVRRRRLVGDRRTPFTLRARRRHTRDRCVARDVRATVGRIIDPATVADEERGEGTTRRQVDDVAEGELIVGETLNPPGGWSSYPPHRHEHEELYLYRFAPAERLRCARLLRRDRLRRAWCATARSNASRPGTTPSSRPRPRRCTTCGHWPATPTTSIRASIRVTREYRGPDAEKPKVDVCVRLPRESWYTCFDPGGCMTATELPTTMPAAVLKGLRHVEVEDLPTAPTRPRRGAARGEPLRHLRQRPALRGPLAGRANGGSRATSSQERSSWSAPR